MPRNPASALVLLLVAAGSAHAQTPTGTITGTVTDSTRAAVTVARLRITQVDTRRTWELGVSAEGGFTAAALLPGEYHVTVEAAGFKRVEQPATVEAGTTTTLNVALELGSVTDSVTVDAAVPRLIYDQHEIAGTVRREPIENLPFNGRNVLELAKLEPGITNPTRGVANRTFIAALGSGLPAIPRVGYTRVTVDGASINLIGGPGTSMQISSEIVQEFRVSTVNFDGAVSLTTNGAVNMVTRSGGNRYHGSAFGFYRNHHLSAYPGIRRDPHNPNPSFERQQVGGISGGPIRRNGVFFIASYERQDQHGVVTVQPAADFETLGGIFRTPSAGNLLSARVDARLASNHSALVRYSRDASRSFGVPAAGVLPSGWIRQTNEADQTIAALTSVVTPNVVNEIRLSRFGLGSLNAAADSRSCGGCFGLSPRRASVSVSGAGLTFGAFPAAFSFGGRRYQVTDQLVWQRRHHRLRLGFDWEHSTTTFAVPDEDVIQLTVWPPERVRQSNRTAPPGAAIVLPASFTTVAEVLQLPLRSFTMSVGPGLALEREFGGRRVLDLYRLFGADTWQVGPALTLNAALAWSYEPNALNHDLTKPALLIPLLGEAGLNPPAPRRTNFSPALGFAWASDDARMVVRGGIGRYFDPAGSTNSTNLGNERLLLSPLGTGRLTFSGANIRWEGTRLEFAQPTSFSAAQLLSIVDTLSSRLAGELNPDNRDFRLRNLNRTKEGTNLYDPSYSQPSAVHVGIGLQRELPRRVVVSADFVWRRFSNTFINGIDYNRFRSEGGEVIPACTEAERDDVHAMCSNGPLRFDTTRGRARYAGLLVRADARERAARFVASYAFGSYVGSNGTGTGTAEMGSGRAPGFNNDDWFENYGPLPTDLRHVLNLSGYVDLPWRLQLAFNLSVASRPPFTAWLQGVDINGDGTSNDLLPGSRVNQVGRGLDHDDLRVLVERYNQEVAGRPLCCGQIAPTIRLPEAFDFNDTFFTQDVRVTCSVVRGQRVRVLVIAEVFNLFNTANLVQFSGNLLEPSAFGRPGGRFTQVFGSGGPRALQLGARVSF